MNEQERHTGTLVTLLGSANDVRGGFVHSDTTPDCYVRATDIIALTLDRGDRITFVAAPPIGSGRRNVATKVEREEVQS